MELLCELIEKQLRPSSNSATACCQASLGFFASISGQIGENQMTQNDFASLISALTNKGSCSMPLNDNDPKGKRNDCPNGSGMNAVMESLREMVSNSVNLRRPADEQVNGTFGTTVANGSELSERLSVLESKVVLDRKNIINVDRANVLGGGIRGFTRSSFSPLSRLDVRFVDEDAIDEGGPMREFMRLSLQKIQNLPIFEGEENRKMITFEESSFKKRTYFVVGQMIAYFIVHRGPNPKFFSPVLYSLISEDIESLIPTLTDITNKKLRIQIMKIADSATAEQFRLAVNDATDIIRCAGCTSLSVGFSLESKTQLVNTLSKFVVREPLEQFREGLSTMGVLSEIQGNKQIWKELFLHSSTSLDAVQVENLFTIDWSEANSSRRNEERRTVSYWLDLLQDLEDGVDGPATDRKIGLHDVLIFATGADSVPTLGFHPAPTLAFNHPEDNQNCHLIGMPLANTCAMELKLPVVKDFDMFKSRMVTAMEMACTFTSQ